jgi:predicted RNA-binding protein with PUA-like domain
MGTAKQHWLVKAEPKVFGFDALWASPGRRSAWDGVRNYQARNHLRAMRKGDLVFVYHSNAEPPGIVGIAEVAREAYPDPTQFEAGHEHFDQRSKPDAPAWDMVDLRALEALPRLVALDELRQEPALASLGVVQRGSRLSVQPVSPAHWKHILALSKRKPKA